MEQIRYGQGGLNTDDSVEIISPDDYPYAANFVSGRSQFSQNGTKELLRGTNVIDTDEYLDENSLFIGGVRSVTDDIYFLCFYNTDPEKNCILKLDNDVVTPVMIWSGLNFSPAKEHRINGGGVAGDLLFITDNYNEQRCIHASRYSVTPPDSEEEILVIKRGPQIPPTFKKMSSGDVLRVYVLDSALIDSIQVSETIGTDLPESGYLFISGIEYTYGSRAGNVFSSVSPSPLLMVAGSEVEVREVPSQNLINNFSFQFAYHYEYEDKQVSVLSPYSRLCVSSVLNENYRRIEITIPNEETIPALVNEIVISARVNNTGTFFEIGRLKRTGGEFDVKSFDFYNNTNGNVLPVFLQQPFSLVPRKSGSMAISKSRLWIGNFLDGYNTPTDIDLSTSMIVIDPEASASYPIQRILKETYEYQQITDEFGTYLAWVVIEATYVEFDGITYIIKRGDVFDVVEFDPDTYNIGDPPIQRHIGFTDLLASDYASSPIPEAEFIGDIYINYSFVNFTNGSFPSGVTPTIDFNPAISTLNGLKTFPSDSSYKIGVVFSDSQGRKSGVFTKDDLIVNTPNRQVNQTQIAWNLSSSDNIPSWAKYYSIAMTKNLKKSFYIENNAINIEYRKITTAGTESVSYGGSGVEHKDYPEIKINLRNFPYNKLSYAFIEGDRIVLRNVGVGNDTTIDIPIKSFDGSYLICDRGDLQIEFTPNAFAQIEIYRPITTGGQSMLFYEIGQSFKINDNLVSGDPEFSVTSGIIEGDSVVVAREVYELDTEVVSNGNQYAFKSISLDGDGAWNTDIGRPFIQTPIGEVQKSAYIRHSGTYIAGTELNALSDFDSGDEGNIPIESGTVQKLQPTHKESVEGDVLLAIANSDTFSLYIDEARVTQGQSSFLIGSTKVIGDIRKQRSGFGTLHPESVLEEDGYVYFFDKLSRAFVRYASNGLFPLSEYKVVTHFETQAQLNDVDDFAVSGYDPYYKVIFVSFTNALTNTKKTIAYSIPKERWLGFVDFAPEGYITGSASMYSVKGGVLYKHNNETNFNRFYSIDCNAVIDYSFNDDPASTKDWKAVEVGCSPNLYAFSNANQSVITNGLQVDVSNRHGQATNILFNEFEVDENVVHADIKGDLNTGGVLDGDQIYSNSILCRTTMVYGANKYLLYVKAGFELGRGHTL